MSIEALIGSLVGLFILIILGIMSYQLLHDRKKGIIDHKIIQAGQLLIGDKVVDLEIRVKILEDV
jgi:hypothetical protein